MLDLHGFVAETNACNIFCVAGDRLLTPTADACLPGVTRSLVIDLCAELGIPCDERNVSLTEFVAADEVFTTGTMGELTPVVLIDHRQIGSGAPGPMVARLSKAFRTLIDREGYFTPLPPVAAV